MGQRGCCRIHENNSGLLPPLSAPLSSGHLLPGQTILGPEAKVAGKKDFDFASQPPPHWLPLGLCRPPQISFPLPGPQLAAHLLGGMRALPWRLTVVDQLGGGWQSV